MGRSYQAEGNSHRSLRIGEAVRFELSKILLTSSHHISEIDGLPITITEVRPSKDLRFAKVFVAALGNDSIALAELLNSVSGRLTKEVARNIKLKYTPKLKFFADNSFEYASEIGRLMSMESNKD